MASIIPESSFLMLSPTKFQQTIRKMTVEKFEQLSESNRKELSSRLLKDVSPSLIISFFSNTSLVVQFLKSDLLSSNDFKLLILNAYKLGCLGYIANRKELFKKIVLSRCYQKYLRNFLLLYELCSTQDELRSLYRNFWLISILIRKDLISFNDFLLNLKSVGVFADFMKSEVFNEYFENYIASDQDLKTLWEELLVNDDYYELARFCSHRSMFVYVVKKELVDFGNILKLKDMKHISKFVQKLDLLRKATKENEQCITDDEFFAVIHQIVERCAAENNVRVFSGLQSSKELCEHISNTYFVDLNVERREYAEKEICSVNKNVERIVEELEILDDGQQEIDLADVLLDSAQTELQPVFQQPIEKIEIDELKARKKTSTIADKKDSFEIGFLLNEEKFDAESDPEFDKMLEKFFKKAKEMNKLTAW